MQTFPNGSYALSLAEFSSDLEINDLDTKIKLMWAIFCTEQLSIGGAFYVLRMYCLWVTQVIYLSNKVYLPQVTKMPWKLVF